MIGPVYQYENGNAIKPQVIPSPSAYCYQRSSIGKPERPIAEAPRNGMSHTKQMPNCGMAAKLTSDIAINMESSNNPLYMTRAGVTKADRVNDRVVIDTELLQTKGQYGGLSAAVNVNVAAHRKVGSVQLLNGVGRTY